MGRKFPIDPPHWKRQASAVFALGLGVSILHTVLQEIVIAAVQVRPDHDPSIAHFLSVHLLSALPLNLVVYGAILGAGYAMDYYHRFREHEIRVSRLEHQLVQARLETLISQLHPHFLFNTLNAISALVERDPAATRRMIARISDLLRLTLETKDRHEIPLAQELSFLRHYLDIEQIRYQDRLRLDWEIHPGLEEALVPPMVLQPLVENAVRHGIGQRTAGGAVRIGTRRENGRLILEVQDDGPGIRAGQDRTSPNGGMGLHNTRSRLEQLYGGHAALELYGQERGFVARISIPYHTVPVIVEEAP
jgi:sensor histidine kinase YesM